MTSQSLQQMVDHLKELRGNPEEWLRKQSCMTRFLTETNNNYRVLCRGEYRDPRQHTPAVLVYNLLKDCAQVIIPNIDCSATTQGPLRYFFSTIPYQGIAKEVLAKSG